MPFLLRSPMCVIASTLVAASIVGLPSAAFAAELPAAPTLSYDVPDDIPSAATDDDDAAEAVATVDDASLECLAKVVHHESRGQPHRGQIAVAQAVLNRLKAGGRFGDSVCAVTDQPGQFFNTRAYKPQRQSSGWDEAVTAAREAMTGEAQAAAPGAMFFHAAYAPRNHFFRSRQRVAAIGGQIFYR